MIVSIASEIIFLGEFFKKILKSKPYLNAEAHNR